jgi:two-component system CheB/CheR fusion protein
MIVDDDPLVVEITKQMLVCERLNTRQWTNANEALELIQTGKVKPDILLTDYNMKEMSGVELIKSIRRYEEASNLKPLPVIVCSGNTSEEFKRVCT